MVATNYQLGECPPIQFRLLVLDRACAVRCLELQCVNGGNGEQLQLVDK